MNFYLNDFFVGTPPAASALDSNTIPLSYPQLESLAAASRQYRPGHEVPRLSSLSARPPPGKEVETIPMRQALL